MTVDLVTDLPKLDGYTAIAVFVDRYTKMVHFAPCRKEVTAMEYAKLFVDHVFRLCCGSTLGSGYYWCLLQLYYVISLYHPDLQLIEVILVPMLLSALHSDDFGGSCGPLKTQYLGSRGAGRECLGLELDYVD